MGNHQSSPSMISSCFRFPIIQRSKNDKNSEIASLFDGQGNLLRRVDLPMRAAEVMIEEEPGHVIIPAENLRRNRRFVAAKAEDELVAGESYVLVPICKLNRRASEPEMAALEELLLSSGSRCKKKKMKKRSSRVSPSSSSMGDSEMISEEVRVLEESVGSELGFVCRQRVYCRGWTPALGTISEST